MVSFGLLWCQTPSRKEGWWGCGLVLTGFTGLTGLRGDGRNAEGAEGETAQIILRIHFFMRLD